MMLRIQYGSYSLSFQFVSLATGYAGRKLLHEDLVATWLSAGIHQVICK